MPNLIDTRGCLSATADKSARIVKDKNGISATQQEALWGNKAAGRPHRVEDFSDFRMT
jgi:accessory colonization factor AcfC